MISRYIILFFLLLFINDAKASYKQKIIFNLKKTKNLSFNIEQNINNKIEKGKCTIQYPKKIYCKYDLSNNKIFVSNGKSIVIKTDIGSYYRYSLEETPLNLILDKNFLLREINTMNENIIDEELIKYSLIREGLKIDVFFDKDSFNVAGWQTLDIYQNISLTRIYNLVINQEINTDIFVLPKPN